MTGAGEIYKSPVTVVCGPPGAGKTTYVAERKQRGDLVVDVDSLWCAVSGCRTYDKPVDLLPFVLEARNAIIGRLLVANDVRQSWLITSGANDTRDDHRERGANVVVLETPEAVCIDRIENDNRPDADDWRRLVGDWWAKYDRHDDDEIILEGNRGMAKDNIERRAFGVCTLEIRVEGEVESPVIVGHAAVFEQTSDDLGGFVERVAPGAFSKSIGGDVRALFNHDPSQILGRTTAKTLRLREDQRGLAVEIDPPDSNAGRDVVIAMKRGDLTQMSFGFRTIQDSWEHFHDDPSKLSIRTLIEVELRDVSPVTFPAYPQTDVALRSLDQWNTDHKSPAPAIPNLVAARQLQAEIIY